MTFDLLNHVFKGIFETFSTNNEQFQSFIVDLTMLNTGTSFLSLPSIRCKFATLLRPTEANVCIGAHQLKFYSSNTT